MPHWDEARLRAALDRWSALPPGHEQDRAACELHAALRALPAEDAQRLVASIYRAFRAAALRERTEARETAE